MASSVSNTAVNTAHSSLPTWENEGFFKALGKVTDDKPPLAHPSLAKIIAEYLFPEPQGWIAEWTGAHGYDVVHKAVLRAYFHITVGRYDLGERSGQYGRFILGCERNVDLIVQYLQKSDIFALSDAEICEAALTDITPLTRGPRSLVLQYLNDGSAESTKSFPLEIDDEMQTPLAQYFDAETLQDFPTISKVTELFALYWRPAGMTACIAEQVAKKYGQQLTSNRNGLDQMVQEFDSPASSGCWIQFPNEVLKRGRGIVLEQNALRAGFEPLSRFSETVFCVFTRYVCTSTRLLPGPAREELVPGHANYFSRTYTRCQEDGGQIGRVFIGCFNADGLSVCPIESLQVRRQCVGNAIMRKFYVDTDGNK